MVLVVVILPSEATPYFYFNTLSVICQKEASVGWLVIICF
jgi:hypothetical protein